MTDTDRTVVTDLSSRAGAVAATVIGIGDRDHGRRAPGVEANARLTGTIGLVLLVMLAAEGLTLASIRHLLAWHIAIGIALIPPVLVKLGSTTWRFSRYYLADPRYRQAGPPHPILRVLGPIAIITTVAVFASGVASALAGPHNHTLVTVHQASFAVWFAAMTIHVIAHTLRATRLARADLEAPRRHHRTVPYVRSRQGLALGSVALGIAAAFATTGLADGWSLWMQRAH